MIFCLCVLPFAEHLLIILVCNNAKTKKCFPFFSAIKRQRRKIDYKEKSGPMCVCEVIFLDRKQIYSFHYSFSFFFFFSCHYCGVITILLLLLICGYSKLHNLCRDCLVMCLDLFRLKIVILRRT